MIWHGGRRRPDINALADRLLLRPENDRLRAAVITSENEPTTTRAAIHRKRDDASHRSTTTVDPSNSCPASTALPRMPEVWRAWDSPSRAQARSTNWCAVSGYPSGAGDIRSYRPGFGSARGWPSEAI